MNARRIFLVLAATILALTAAGYRGTIRPHIGHGGDLGSQLARDLVRPGSGHTQAMVDRPAEYERRLVEFFGATIGGGS